MEKRDRGFQEAYKVQRLLRRLLGLEGLPDPLQQVDLSAEAKERASQAPGCSLVPPAADSTRPDNTNLAKQDFIQYQRELAASLVTGTPEPSPPQRIAKLSDPLKKEEKKQPSPKTTKAPSSGALDGVVESSKN